MRRWFLLILAFILLLAPQAAVHAQNEVSFQSLEVDVWPEYDQELKVLVIYRIKLAPTVKLPAEITLRIPSQAGAPHAVAEMSGDTLTNVAGGFEMAGRDGDYALVHFTATLPEIQIEYYDPQLTQDGSRRTFVYRWPGDYAVEDLLVSFQQPPTATGLQVQPSMGSLTTGTDGLNYFNLAVGAVTAGTPFDVEFSYAKDNNDLTNARTFQQTTPASSVTTTTPGRMTLTQVLPWLLGGLGLALIAGGIFWYTRAGRLPEPPVRARRHRSTEAEPAQEAAFCHQCGKRASGGDVFCRSCGTRLKN